MTWTALLVAVCLVGHPDRCAVYGLATDAPPDACLLAVAAWAITRPYLVAGRAVCREETGA